MGQWLDDLGCQVIDRGGPLQPAKTLRSSGRLVDNGGANEVTGYSIIAADSLEAALGIARNGPRTKPPHRYGSVEVAELIEM